MNMNPVVTGIGELLWDVFPGGKRLGGAPVNFACHCGQLGAKAYPVSCIGRDELGTEIREVLTSLNVDHSYVAEDAEHPTGTVQVTLDEGGKPSYEICEGVAWDVVPMSGTLGDLAQKADAVCFGSLAQRSVVTRATIRQFLQMMRPGTLKIFDVNLRQSFYSREIIEESLELSNILKLSDEELPVLAEMFSLAGSVQDQLVSLLEMFGLILVAYTRGAEGSLLLGPGEVSDHSGTPVEVADSVGAGDSFTAALCMGLLNEDPLSEINDHANRVASFVCSQKGATPVLPIQLASATEMAGNSTE